MKQVAIIPSLNFLSVILHQHHDSDCETVTFTGANQQSMEGSSRFFLWGQTITVQMERLKIWAEQC